MIQLHTFATPNGVKIPILLEELGAPYELRLVNVKKGAQSTPDFLALNPNGRIPVIVDTDGPGGQPVTLTESGAILIYLAEKFGGFIPTDPVARVKCLEWLFFQVAGLGPMFGQAGYFLKSAPEKIDFAIARYSGEAARHLKVLDGRLAQVEWLAGDEISIADVAHFGWIWRRAFAEVSLDDAPNVARWFAAMEARPGVQKGVAALTA
jgi:GST-like protein